MKFSTVKVISFFISLFFLTLLSAVIGMLFGMPICDESKNIDCSFYLSLFIFITPLILNILLYLILESNRAKKIDSNPKINKITGILEIILSPIITGVYVFVTSIVREFNGPESEAVGLQLNFSFVSIVIFLVLIIDGIRRILVKK